MVDALRREEQAALAALKMAQPAAPQPKMRGRLRLWRRVPRRPRLPCPRRKKRGAEGAAPSK